MATINFSANGYNGEVLEDFLVYTAQGNETYEEGLIHIVPGIQKKKTLPHIQLGAIIQDNKPTPTSTQGGPGLNGENTYNISERYLEPQDFMVYIEFNPRDFEEYWKPFQPEGKLVFRELDPKVQATMAHLLLDKKDAYIGQSIWCSRKGGINAAYVSDDSENITLGGSCDAGPMKYFDGAVMRVINNVQAALAANPTDDEKNEVASGKIIVAGNTPLTTGAQIQAALYAMWRKAPKRVRKSPKYRFVMNGETWDILDNYWSDKDVKYADDTDENKKRFKGKRISVINDLPENTIFLGKFTRDTDSCLWMGVDYATDQDSLVVEPLQNNSELYFFQMRLKADVNLVLPGEIVVWTTYHKNILALSATTASVAQGASTTVAVSASTGQCSVASSQAKLTASISEGTITIAAAADCPTGTHTVTVTDSTGDTATIEVTVS